MARAQCVAAQHRVAGPHSRTTDDCSRLQLVVSSAAEGGVRAQHVAAQVVAAATDTTVHQSRGSLPSRADMRHTRVDAAQGVSAVADSSTTHGGCRCLQDAVGVTRVRFARRITTLHVVAVSGSGATDDTSLAGLVHVPRRTRVQVALGVTAHRRSAVPYSGAADNGIRTRLQVSDRAREQPTRRVATLGIIAISSHSTTQHTVLRCLVGEVGCTRVAVALRHTAQSIGAVCAQCVAAHRSCAVHHSRTTDDCSRLQLVVSRTGKGGVRAQHVAALCVSAHPGTSETKCHLGRKPSRADMRHTRVDAAQGVSAVADSSTTHGGCRCLQDAVGVTRVRFARRITTLHVVAVSGSGATDDTSLAGLVHVPRRTRVQVALGVTAHRRSAVPYSGAADNGIRTRLQVSDRAREQPTRRVATLGIIAISSHSTTQYTVLRCLVGEVGCTRVAVALRHTAQSIGAVCCQSSADCC